MLILAISCKGQEYLYKKSTAHKVSKASANKICQALNTVKYKLNDNEVWHIHEVYGYEDAAVYAEGQEFKIYRNNLREVIR